MNNHAGPSSSKQTGYNPYPNNIVANQISGFVLDQTQGNVENFMQTLNSEKYQHLMSMLNRHLTAAKTVDEGTNSGHVSGTCLSISVNSMLNSPKHWVMDSGATSHVCFRHACFQSLRAVHNAYITLPNHNKIPVHFAGRVKLLMI